jgi:hypothetical protein
MVMRIGDKIFYRQMVLMAIGEEIFKAFGA